jgi:hypothetical protein
MTTSDNAATAQNALSIQPWTSGKPQQAGMWLQIELPQPALVTELSFESAVVAPENATSVPGAPTRTAIAGRGRGGAAADAAAPPQPGYPRGYDIQVSTDGTRWTSVAKGQGTGINTDVTFAPVRAKFVRITQTASTPNAPVWSVQRLRLFEPGSAAARQ